MGATSRRGLWGLTAWIGVAIILSAVATEVVFGANVLLYDFESGVEGWENESPSPVPPQVVRTRSRHGESALGFLYTFSPTSRILNCRVKDGFPRDYSTAEFRGFSAWVFIPVPSKGWEARMFVRTGADWKLQLGRSIKNLLPGWHRVQIRREDIDALDTIQDLGIHVILTSPEKITAEILIDQVEANFYP